MCSFILTDLLKPTLPYFICTCMFCLDVWVGTPVFIFVFAFAGSSFLSFFFAIVPCRFSSSFSLKSMIQGVRDLVITDKVSVPVRMPTRALCNMQSTVKDLLDLYHAYYLLPMCVCDLAAQTRI